MDLTYRVILFDFDGTLFDSGPGIIRCLRETIRERRLPRQPLTVLQKFIGPPLKAMFEDVFRLTPDEAQTAVDVYRKNYRGSKGFLEGHVYHGVLELLKKLNAVRIICAVASAKKQNTVLKTLRHFHLDGYFKAIYGSAENDEYPEKTQIIAECLEVLNISPKEYGNVLMVGDTALDSEAASRLNIDFCMALWGYGFKEEEERNSARCVFRARTPSQLSEILLH